MKTKRFYVLSLCAILRKASIEKETARSFEVGLGAWTVMAENERDALRQGKLKALEKWPVAAGWASHTCAAGEIPREELAAILAELSQ